MSYIVILMISQTIYSINYGLNFILQILVQLFGMFRCSHKLNDHYMRNRRKFVRLKNTRGASNDLTCVTHLFVVNCQNVFIRLSNKSIEGADRLPRFTSRTIQVILHHYKTFPIPCQILFQIFYINHRGFRSSVDICKLLQTCKAHVSVHSMLLTR